jgi:hypothetical protein
VWSILNVNLLQIGHWNDWKKEGGDMLMFRK